MSIDSMVCLVLIESAESHEALWDLGRRIKYELDNDYEWTRDTHDVDIVRAAWTRTYERLNNLDTASI